MRAKWHRPVEWTFEREAPLLPTWKRNNFISSRERERDREGWDRDTSTRFLEQREVGGGGKWYLEVDRKMDSELGKCKTTEGSS